MKPIKLTICILSLHSRAKLLAELLDCLQAQPRIDETEILISIDGGQEVTGTKRNRLLNDAQGQYIVHIDDDDLVASDYASKILAAIERAPGVDAVALRGQRRDLDTGKLVEFDYRAGGKEGEWIDGVIWRSPSHLCPIRRDIARSLGFPSVTNGEDIAWSSQLAARIKTVERAGAANEVLYFYRWDPKKLSEQFAPHKLDRTHTKIFSSQYAKFSGPGSTLEFSEPYRLWLGDFIQQNRIKSILDLGCGDMTVMSNVDLHGVSYLGIDVIAERIARNNQQQRSTRKVVIGGRVTTIEEELGKPVEPTKPRLRTELGDARLFKFQEHYDLIICKDVIQHWATDEITAFLSRLGTASFRYALITNCAYGETINTEIATGGWRAIDLTREPFHLGDIVFSWGDPNKDVVLLEPSSWVRDQEKSTDQLAFAGMDDHH